MNTNSFLNEIWHFSKSFLDMVRLHSNKGNKINSTALASHLTHVFQFNIYVAFYTTSQAFSNQMGDDLQINFEWD